MYKQYASMAGKLVLVSGVSGFIGTHVVKQTLEAGYKVRGTVRSMKDPKKYEYMYELTPNARQNLELVEAELLDAESWVRAVKGVDYVLHVASPFPMANPKHEDDLIVPAREGTLGVLRAAANEKSVKRVVVTSSLAAISEKGGNKYAWDEDHWSNPTNLGNLPYNKSKIVAERAAWAFHDSLPSDSRFELCTVNPVIVTGPVLHGTIGTSVQVIQMTLDKVMPACLPLCFPFVDVRDVAKAHVKCLTVPEAAGNRHLLHSYNVWAKEVAEILNKEFGPQGYDISTDDMPTEMLNAICSQSAEIKQALEFNGRPMLLDNTRFTKVLGITPIDRATSLIDTAYGIIESGASKKTPGYRGPRK